MVAEEEGEELGRWEVEDMFDGLSESCPGILMCVDHS